MKRVSKLGAAGALVAAASMAMASTASAAVKPNWESDAGRFATRAGALHRVALLKAKGLTGYAIEIDVAGTSKTKTFEVQRTFSTKKAATAEVAKVHKAKFFAIVEQS